MITPLSISEINKKAGKGQGTGSCPASSIFKTFEFIFLTIPAGQGSVTCTVFGGLQNYDNLSSIK